MKLKEVMTAKVEVISPDATLQQAAQRMRDLNIGAIPICDGERLLGMLTDRDIVVRAAAKGYDPAKTPVREVMTPEIVYTFEDEDIREAVTLMEDKKVRRLPVLDRQKRLVGIVSLDDLAAAEAGLAGQALREVSEPARTEARGKRRKTA